MTFLPDRGRPKGIPKHPNSGRKKGGFNKDRYLFREKLEDLDFDTLGELIKLLKKPYNAAAGTGITDSEKADKMLQMLKFQFPTLAAVQMAIEKKADPNENGRLDQLHAEFRTMLADRPKDIECHGQTLPQTLSSPSPAPSQESELSTASLKQKAPE